MKELSIEQKAQRYDEAIERARQLLIDGCSNYDKETIWNIFPELKESEDEKVIKSINRLISHYYDVNFPTPEGFTREELVSWLKKQIDKQQSKSAIKEEKVEDEKMKKELISFVRGMLACHDKPNAERDEKYESWIAWLEKQGTSYTKRDVDDAYLKGVCDAKQELEKQGGQKPAWSEEDEMFVHGLIRGLAAKRDIYGHTTFSSDCIDITETINWLKSLKDRVQPQK